MFLFYNCNLIFKFKIKMKNIKMEKDFSRATGLSNMNTYNFVNPENANLVLKNKEWVNPNMPDHQKENKRKVKTII